MAHRIARTEALSQASPIEIVLERLEKVRRSGSGWTARCPSHEDRFPSLSVHEGADGRALVNCHTGCSFDSIVKALRLEPKDLFPRDEDWKPRPRSKQKPVRLPRSTARILVESSQFPQAWETAKVLATLQPRQMQRDVLDSWEQLADRLDIPATLELARLVRGVAFFRYGDAKKADDPQHIARCVQRLVEEIAA